MYIMWCRGYFANGGLRVCRSNRVWNLPRLLEMWQSQELTLHKQRYRNSRSHSNTGIPNRKMEKIRISKNKWIRVSIGRIAILTRKLLNQGFLLVKWKFCDRHHGLVNHYGMSMPFTHLWLITGFVTKVTCGSGTAYQSEAPEVIPFCNGVRVAAD